MSFRVPLNWMWGIWLTAAALIAAFVFLPDPQTWRPVLVYTAAVLAGAAALTTAFNNVDQRTAAATKAEEQAQAARVVAALELARWWNEPVHHYRKLAGRQVRDYIRANPSLDKQIEFVKEDVARFTNLIDLLNIFEELSIAIDLKVVDDAAAKRFFRTVVTQYWHATGPIVQKLRAEQTNARLYTEFEKLSNRWENS